jgi:peroxiredoxin Q/BCP
MTDRVDAGDAAPAFSMPTDGGGTTSLAELSGKAVVLYFYPRDDTPGCTKEAIAFTGLIGEFRATGAEVIGVSKDTVAKHDKFKTKYDLDVVLAADEDGSVCEAYGVWVEKNMYGKKSMGIERSTFLIGGDGRIVRAWRKVKVDGHAEEVLAAVKAL